MQDRIQRNGTPEEKQSKAFTTKYLSDLDKHYKSRYLPTISKHANLLVYDWTEEGDMNTIVDEIEHLKFEGYDRDTEKMDDWKFSTLDEQRGARDLFCNEGEQLMYSTLVIRYDIPEMLISGQDSAKHTKVLEDTQENVSIFFYFYIYLQIIFTAILRQCPLLF